MDNEIISALIQVLVPLLVGWAVWSTKKTYELESKIARTNCIKHDEAIDNLKTKIFTLEMISTEQAKITEIIKIMPEIVFQLKEIVKEFSEFKTDFRSISDKMQNLTDKVNEHSYVLKTHGFE